MSTSIVPNSTLDSSRATAPSTIEISWDQFLDGSYPESPVRQLYRNTVIDVAAQAKAALPEANGRVERARDLVLGHLVSRNQDGTFTVRSQSARGKSYTINGECNCPDAAKLVDKRCKHRIATWIWRKAQQVLEAQLGSNGQQPEEATAEASTLDAVASRASTLEPHPEPAAAELPSAPWPDAEPGLNAVPTAAQACQPPACPEAASSVNLYLTIGGYKAQLTLRDMDEERLLTRLEAILKRFPAPEAPQKSAAAEQPATPEGWCRRHDLQMDLQTSKDPNRPGQWWSHRLADGTWCKGK
jgi:hypothetical protein